MSPETHWSTYIFLPPLSCHGSTQCKMGRPLKWPSQETMALWESLRFSEVRALPIGPLCRSAGGTLKYSQEEFMPKFCAGVWSYTPFFGIFRPPLYKIYK